MRFRGLGRGSCPDWRANRYGIESAGLPELSSSVAKRYNGHGLLGMFFIFRDGIMINLCKTCPADVDAMLRRDYQRVAWEKWTSEPARSCLSPLPLIEPAQRWFKRRRLDPSVATAAQAVAAGMWTQEKAAECRLKGAEDGHCLRCAAQCNATHSHNAGHPHM